MPRLSLADVSTGQRVRIVALELEGEGGAWLGAVGLHEGEELVVLRRAAFGGPFHVRTGAGGEFAIADEVAGRIAVVAIAAAVADADADEPS